MASSKEIRIRNVTLIGRGVSEHGHLELQRHHLVFKYLPATNSDQPSSHHLTATIATSESTDERAQGKSNVDASRDSLDTLTRSTGTKQKRKLKEKWVPYPLINHCILKPNPSQATRPQVFETPALKNGGDDSNFPPVYGTNTPKASSNEYSRLVPYDSPNRPVSPASRDATADSRTGSGRDPCIRIRRRDFQMMAFHFQGDSDMSADEAAREVFYFLRHRCCVGRIQEMLAFEYDCPPPERELGKIIYDPRREFARMGIGGKAADGPGSAWRITDINADYSFSPTYPSVLCVPRPVSDNMLKYGGPYRSKCRIPALTYLHSNGGSITRSSQPMPGIQGKRNPQDERLVTAIFSSHTPPDDSTADSPPQTSTSTIFEATTNELEMRDTGLAPASTDISLDEKSTGQEALPRPKIYGSTRRNLIVDARPRINALANCATGGGIEDVSNYGMPSGDLPERIFLDIANIHVMRKSLDKVIESFSSSEYHDFKPNQEYLRKSGWLGHITGLLAGSELIARVVGLGGSHVLLHCSDGWDRTSQVAAIAEIMLDPYYRTFAGFITLIQKDFLSFGHKFHDRHGVLGCDRWFEIENERIAPSRLRDHGNDTGMNSFGSKALSGAKNWFEKNRSSLFRQPNESRSSLDGPGSRPPSPPPNPIFHAPATSNTTQDREHKIKEDEMAPIFHQFLDAVFQLQYQFPQAFEFNPRFLKRLFYHVHAGQYGEFLFNNEKERRAHQDQFASAWPHFVARQAEFTNPDYIAKIEDPLLFPQRDATGSIEVRWWADLFWRKDEDMNTPQSLALPDPDPIPDTSPPAAIGTGFAANRGAMFVEGMADVSLNEAPTVEESKAANMEGLQQSTSTPTGIAQNPEAELVPSEGTMKTEAQDQGSPKQHEASAAVMAGDAEPAYINALKPDLDQGDPLGVSSGQDIPPMSTSKLDKAAFARGSAYSDR